MNGAGHDNHRRRSGIRRALGIVVASAVLAGGAEATTPTPSVLLITIDTLRPDALGWVAGRNRTPALDQIAGEGFRFPAAVAPAPLTLPSHASILTGLVPRRHGARDNGQVVAPGVVSLAERLAARGYATGAVVAGFPLDAMFGLDRGFASYDDTLPVQGQAWGERSALEVTAASLEWLTGLEAGRPFFLWVHYYDPHDPYEPPPEFRRSGPRGAYDGEVAAVDAAVGVLRAGLADRGLDRDVLTVFCADHGEALGEHGEATHGFFVYDSTVLVPLVVHWPGRVRAGQSSLPVRLVDVAPTVLDLVGLPAIEGVDGVSLRPLLEGRGLEPGPALVESLQPWLGYGWAPLAAVRTGGSKLIDAPRPELFDLGNDPGEVENLAPLLPKRVAELRRVLDALRAGGGSPFGGTVDPATLDALRALGYATGSGAPEAPPGLADPKDRLATKRKLDGGERALERGDPSTALDEFREVLEHEPDNRYALLRSAAALGALGRPADAIAPLERLVALDPDHAEAWYRLAEARSLAGQVEAAIGSWREVTRLQPRRAVAWSNLGAMLARTGQPIAAVDALVEATGLAPDDPTLAANLCAARVAAARAELGAGHREGAANQLAAAVAECPGLAARLAGDHKLGGLLP
ncbi:MAG: sulfatase-like hydrolase/transferase [Thermoanaerobaculales bacterium]|jgi:arylsulfatase A-like enzyme|nr:sulfatase-like hydrolase/transferase [Thermoanaerobaculales bacterium]